MASYIVVSGDPDHEIWCDVHMFWGWGEMFRMPFGELITNDINVSTGIKRHGVSADPPITMWNPAAVTLPQCQSRSQRQHRPASPRDKEGDRDQW